MNLSISASDLKTFHGALQCLGRFSDSFWLQCSTNRDGQTQVRLSAINSTNAAFCLFAFDPGFFLNITVDAHHKIECQIQLRTVLSILRARGRNVERCELELVDQGTECRFSIKLHCRHGILKVHKLTYEPRRGLSPSVDSNTPNSFSINAQTAQEWTEHFLSSSKNGEITFHCTPSTCTARSKEEDIAEGKGQVRKAIHTEVKIAVEEFREYSIQSESLLTFPLKEFKAAVTLAETLQVPLDIHFTDGDDPLFIRLGLESTMSAEFVIATSKTGERPAPSSSGTAHARTNPAAARAAIARTRSDTADAVPIPVAKRRRDPSPPTQEHSRPLEQENDDETALPPMHSTPQPPDRREQDETMPLFFPGASQEPNSQASATQNEFDQVPPTPLSKGGDPQEFTCTTIVSQASQSSEEPPSRPRKRFQPLF